MTAPVVVLYVHYPSDLYGAGRSLVRLTAHLDKKRWNPVVVLKEDGPLRIRLEENGVRVRFLANLSVIERKTIRSPKVLLLPFEFLFSVIRLMKIVKEENVSIIHSNTGIILPSALAAKLARVRHVWHIRDWFGEFSGLWHLYSRYILWGSDRVVCVSRAIAAQFPAEPSVVVQNNGFASEEFAFDKTQAARQFRVHHGLEKKFVVGTVGRIKFGRKGQETLVKAVHLLKAKGIDLSCVIVGSVFPGNEDHLERLRSLIRDLQLEDEVRLVGEMTDPRPAYAAMDVFVLPSGQPEPFGGVVMEAMAIGVPVIGTNIGGTVDQIEHEITGLLVPPNNPAELAAMIERLYCNEELRKEFVRQSLNRMQTKFSLSVMATKISEMYEALLAGRT